MALIPPDAGLRMRMQTEAGLLQPVHPVKEIPSDLPELRPGQTFSAQIQEVLPENTYKALIAGRNLTLQLPEGAKQGDVLELVLIDRSAKVLIAQRADTSAAGSAGPYPYATLSRTAQLISQLLLPEGKSAQPAPLNGGQPLLAQPPTNGAELASSLAKAVGQSGLFYEAHQAQWIAGRRPLDSLLAEPQSQRSPLAAGNTGELAATTSRREAGAGAALSPLSATGIPAEGDKSAEVATARASTLAQSVPDEIRPLVQQQLEAVANQRLVWHGEVWPRQTMEMEIEREKTEEREGDGTTEEATRWTTTLRLTMPRLGEINATLQLTGTGIRIQLATPEDTSATDLQNEVPRLNRALIDAGLSPLGVEVKHETR